jgi:hypothetical protein
VAVAVGGIDHEAQSEPGDETQPGLVGSFVIKYTHRAAPISGKTGTNGTRKPRSMSGLVRLSQMTARFTMKNANSVPMLTSSANR